MALEGNLSDFSLAEMFRLLASGKKTGVLHVDGDGVSGLVCFRDGALTYAEVGRGAVALSKRLAHTGAVSPKQLRQALGLQKIQRKDKAGRTLGMILVDEGYLDAGVLEGFVREQLADSLFEMLRLEAGDLRFEADAKCAADDLGMPVDVDAALADADRRISEWDRIREKVPGPDAMFAMSAAPGDRSGEIRVAPREWIVLSHLHGGATVSEVVERSGLDQFETAEVIYQLLEGGLVEPIAMDGGEA